MPINTYTALDKVTVGTATGTVTFTGIPATYTDLRLVISAKITSGSSYASVRFNSDTATNYSSTRVYGTGSAAASDRFSNETGVVSAYFNSTDFTLQTYDVMNYSNATTFKSVLSRWGNNSYTFAEAALWRKTPEVINSITITLNASTFVSGSTFSLYGIRAEGTSPAAKATGGAIYSDSTYYYHVFAASGTFTPTQSISADVLVVAGGGGGGADSYNGADRSSGGGGAGGVIYFASQNLTATAYTATVGGGGAGGTSTTRGTNGVNSSFASLTAAVGGGGGGTSSSSGANIAPSTGGSGGGGNHGSNGAASTQTGTGATAYYGNAGGNGFTNNDFTGGGGGGAGGVGANGNGNDNSGGTGGPGINTYSTWMTATGLGVAGYIAGGGGQSNRNSGAFSSAGGSGGGGGGTSYNAVAYTGSGGAGKEYAPGGNGGSGIVIVRYAK